MIHPVDFLGERSHSPSVDTAHPLAVDAAALDTFKETALNRLYLCLPRILFRFVATRRICFLSDRVARN